MDKCRNQGDVKKVCDFPINRGEVVGEDKGF